MNGYQCVYQDLKQAQLNYCNVYIVLGAELLEGMLRRALFRKTILRKGIFGRKIIAEGHFEKAYSGRAIQEGHC